MTPEEVKKMLQIEIAVLKFDVAEILEERIDKIISEKEYRRKTEAIRRRERRW